MVRITLASIWLLASTAAAQIIICGDADLRVIPTGVQDGFSATQVQPLLLSVRVLDGCSQPVRLVAARAEFSNGDVPVPLLPAFDGQWAGIWLPRNRPSEDVQIIFTAINVASDAKTAGVTVIGGKLLPRPDASGALEVDPSPIRISTTSGAPAQARTIVIVNPANAAQSYSAVRISNGADWITLANANGSVPAAGNTAVVVNFDASRLAPGTYVAVVNVVTGSRTTAVPVTFAVSSARSQMELSAAAMAFSGDAGGRVEPAQQLILRNIGTVPLPWSAQVNTSSGGDWIRVTPGQGSTPADGTTVLQVSANPAGLAPGDYFGQIRFTSTGAANSPQLTSVQLKVAAAGTSISSMVRPTAIVFGGNSAAQQRLSYFNSTSQPVQVKLVTATQRADRWLSVPSAVTVVPPGQTVELPVMATLGDQDTPRYGAVSVVNISAGNTLTVPVLTVARSATGPASDKGQRAAGCAPASLQARLTSINAAATLRVGETKAIEAVVRDNCGTGLSAKSGGTASFRAAAETLRMRDIGNGSWTTTWSPRSEGQQTLVVTAFAFGPNNTLLNLQENLTVTVQGAGARPRTDAGGIVNAASFSGERIAPGSLIAIFGSELSDGIDTPGSTPIPTRLGSTRVELGGRELPLFYSSPKQLNAQVPYDLSFNTDLPLVVTRGTQQSSPDPVIITAAQPAVFTTQQSGGGQGVVFGPDQRTLADAGNPVRAGDALVIYCTGLGATNPAVVPGEPAPVSTLARTDLPVSVTIGGQNAQILYSGLAPGFAGLYQVNAVVPPGVARGNAVELKLRVADLESPAVTIGVRD